MYVWTVVNQKGGVGKTTTVITLGTLLARQGYRTLMVDLDPQGSMTSYFRHDPDHLHSGGVYQLFRDYEADITRPRENLLADTGIAGLDLLGAPSALAALDKQLAHRKGMGLVLKHRFSEWQSHYDFVLLDCAPVLGTLMVNALAASHHVLAPVQTEAMAIRGLERLLNTLRMVNRNRTQPLNPTIIPTMFDRRTRASRAARDSLDERFPGQVWDGSIPMDTKFREASDEYLPLPLYRADSRGALAYENLLFDLQEQYTRNSDWRKAG